MVFNRLNRSQSDLTVFIKILSRYSLDIFFSGKPFPSSADLETMWRSLGGKV